MNLGDIKIDKLYKKYVWVVCPDCGKEHWVRVKRGKPEYMNCHKCATQRVSNRPVIMYPRRTLKEAYIQDYGKDLENRFDSAENVKDSERVFCRDCPCPLNVNWKDCPLRAEALKIMRGEL